MKNGDWGYIKNNPRYRILHPNGSYRGENIIMVGRQQYFGFPAEEPLNMAEWTSVLISAYNTDLPAGEPTIHTIPGWQRGENQFIDVWEVAMKVFDYRVDLKRSGVS
jgi:hypothetical protein